MISNLRHFIFFIFLLPSVVYGQTTTLSCISRIDGTSMSVELKTNRDDGGNGTVIINENRNVIGTFNRTTITWTDRSDSYSFYSSLNRLTGVLTVVSKSLISDDFMFTFDCKPLSRKF